ncbi:MAG: hypothetical protein WA190_13635 [Usitatibacter sp.]
MNPADLDHDGRRELERHALRNVSWLAAKLGYQDALEKRTERKLVIGMGVFTAIALAVLVTGILTAQTPAGEMARRRCEVQVRVDKTVDMRARVFRDHPEMNSVQREQFVEKTISTLAMHRCSSGSVDR